MTTRQGNEPVDMNSMWRRYHNAVAMGPLKIHLAAHKFDSAIRSLLPFYGVNCPIAVLNDNESEDLVGRATLGAVEGWTPPAPLLLVVG